jgi:magnesium-transporting ATPase (P-type)
LQALVFVLAEDRWSERMATQQQETKPRRMHGIVPTPLEIPPEHQHLSKGTSSSDLPLFVQLMAAFALCRAVFFLLLALVPWSDPQSSIATFLIARSTLLLSLLPRSLLICQETPDGCSMNSLVKVLPFMFLLVGVVYLFSAWKMWNLDKFWISIIRWAIMFQAGATVVKMMIALSARYIGAAEAPLSDAMRLAIVLMIGWNLLIFGCFAFFPRIEDAYDSKV